MVYSWVQLSIGYVHVHGKYAYNLSINRKLTTHVGKLIPSNFGMLSNCNGTLFPSNFGMLSNCNGTLFFITCLKHFCIFQTSLIYFLLEYLKSKSTLNTEHDGIFAQVNKVEVTDIHFWNFLSSLGHQINFLFYRFSIILAFQKAFWKIC